jgi:hypothetical protein
MGRKKKDELDDPERSARFIETAEWIQAEDAEEGFEEAMKRILKSREATKIKEKIDPTERLPSD